MAGVARVSYAELLEFCFARFRTCCSLARWVLKRLVGEEPPRECNARRLIEWVYEKSVEEAREEARGSVSRAVVEERGRALAESRLSVLFMVLESEYGGLKR